MIVIGIGNAIVDVLCKVSDDFLKDYSLIKSTMKLIDDKEFKKLLSNLKIEETVSGGSVANSIVGMSQLGNNVGFIGKIKSNLKGYKIYVSKITPSEKIKNIKTVEHFLNKLLALNFNRSDLIIGVGGGIIGDITSFISSVFNTGFN